MNTVKPSYKFISPYWTNDELGKQGTVCGYEIVDLAKNPIEVIKVSNSEKNYYKKCTRDLSRKDLNTLRREFRKGFIMQAAQLMNTTLGNASILNLLTTGEPVEDKTHYSWKLMKRVTDRND